MLLPHSERLLPGTCPTSRVDGSFRSLKEHALIQHLVPGETCRYHPTGAASHVSVKKGDPGCALLIYPHSPSSPLRALFGLQSYTIILSFSVRRLLFPQVPPHSTTVAITHHLPRQVVFIAEHPLPIITLSKHRRTRSPPKTFIAA